MCFDLEQIALGFSKEFALTRSWQASRLRSQLWQSHLQTALVSVAIVLNDSVLRDGLPIKHGGRKLDPPVPHE